MERLAGYCRVVLPRTVVAYRSLAKALHATACDRPVARALGFATDDVLADWERGSELLVELLDNASGRDAVDRARRRRAKWNGCLSARGWSRVR